MVIAMTARCGQLLIYRDTRAVAVIVEGQNDPSTVTRLLDEAANDYASDLGVGTRRAS